MAPPKRILIAHPDPETRNGVREVAEKRLGMFGTLQAHSFDTMIEKLRKEPGTELVIVDFDLPGMFWEFGLRHLLANHNGMRIAVLFSSPDQEKLRSCEAKFAALVPKQLPKEALQEVLMQVLKGKDYFPASGYGSAPAVPFLKPTPFSGRSEEVPSHLQASDSLLTGRQIDVLQLLSEGYSNHEIAQALAIADGTVKVHVNAAFRILGVHNRVSAAAAFRQYIEERLARAGDWKDNP